MAQTDSAPLTERQQYWLKHIRACDAAGQWHIQLPNGVVIAFGGAVDAKSLSMVLSTAANLS